MSSVVVTSAAYAAVTMETSRRRATPARPSAHTATSWRPLLPLGLMLVGIPCALLSVWVWWEAREEGAWLFTALAAMLAAASLTVAAVGVIAEGVRLGIAASRPDDTEA